MVVDGVNRISLLNISDVHTLLESMSNVMSDAIFDVIADIGSYVMSVDMSDVMTEYIFPPLLPAYTFQINTPTIWATFWDKLISFGEAPWLEQHHDHVM